MTLTFAPGIPGTISVAIDGQPAGTIPQGLSQLDTLQALAWLVEAATAPPAAPETQPAPVEEPAL